MRSPYFVLALGVAALAVPPLAAQPATQSSARSAPAPAGATPADWIALPTPRLCEPRAVEAAPAPLAAGSHVLHPTDGPSLKTAPPPVRLPLPVLSRILEDETARGSRLEFFKSAATLLVRGDPASIDAARARIAELDRIAESLAIDLEVELSGSGAPRAADARTTSDARTNAAGTSNGDAKSERWTAKRRVASGEDAFFGSRLSTAFVMTFDVEVAADSGVAAPVLGSACTGRTIHLRSARVDGGRRVRIEGLLDLADLRSVDRFDPETADLGVVQEPSVDSVQVAFAGVVESGKPLEVKLAGAPLALQDWTLSIRATAKPDEASGAEAPAKPEDRGAKDSALDVLDLGGLAATPLALSAASPGAVLDRQAPFGPASPTARASSGVPPSAIAAQLDARGSDGSASGRPSIAWSDDLLLLRRSDGALRSEARALVAGAEAPRLVSRRLEVKRGALAASFPACSGSPARLLVGRERTAVSGYRVQIAPQTWMAAPEVVKVFDGFCLDAEIVTGSADCSVWVAESAPSVVAPRKDAQIGKLEILSRSLRSDRGSLAPGDPERAFAARPPNGSGDAAGDAIGVRCILP